MQFSELDLHPDLLKSIQEIGYEQCTEVQEKTFSNTFKGQDVIIQSKTGTGKTAAFLISIYNSFTTSTDDKKNFALIIAPTRELALQIEKEATVLGKYLPYKIATFYGGVGYQKQEQQLAKGVDIMIATPGRLIDFIRSKKIHINNVSYFVVDEADRMFDMGFSKDIEFIVKKLPDSTTRRTIFLSATINRNVKIFAGKFIHDPVEIDLSPDQLIVENVEHYISHVSLHEKFSFLLGLLEKKKPKTAFIFTNTKHAAVNIAEKLKLHGIPAEYIIGDLPQKKRTSIINRIKENKVPFLVATDVAARGIHVNELDMVINYDLPEDPENYVHRVGRTARAGKKGVAYSFVCERFVYGLEPLENFLDIKIPVFWPEDDYFVDTSGMDYSSITSFESRKNRGSGNRRRDDQKKRNKNMIKPGTAKGARKRPGQQSSNQGRKAQSYSKSNTKQKTNTNQRKHPVKTNITPKKKHNLDKRLQMYKEKYGEEFTLATSSSNKKHKSSVKDGFFTTVHSKIAKIFSRKREK